LPYSGHYSIQDIREIKDFYKNLISSSLAILQAHQTQAGFLRSYSCKIVPENQFSARGNETTSNLKILGFLKIFQMTNYLGLIQDSFFFTGVK